VKLYLAPGACSLSPHIVLRELGLPFEAVRVDLKTKMTKSGENFLDVNPKGFVPALVLPDGEILTEGPAIVQYLADRKPEAKLAPPLGSMERYHLMEWLNFITSELHKGFSPLFNPHTPEAYRTIATATLGARFDFLAKRLDGRSFILGDSFTVADAYAFTVLSWHRPVKLDLAPWPPLVAFLGRIRDRPAVRDAMKAEGLIL
jgi:glutathione S-transferase